MDTCPTLRHTQRKQQRLSTDKNQIGLRVQKINIRVHNQQATGCCLGASLLRNEVVVRELNEVATCVLLIICRTCRSRAKGCRQKGRRQKRKKGESKYQRHVLARQDRLCSPVGNSNCPAIWWSLAAAKQERTYRDTLQHPSKQRR